MLRRSDGNSLEPRRRLALFTSWKSISEILYVRPIFPEICSVQLPRPEGGQLHAVSVLDAGFSAGRDLISAALRELGMESVLLARAGRAGCLVLCPEAHTKRLWQDAELAAAFLLARMLSQHLGKG